MLLEALLHKGPMPVNTVGKKLLLTSGSITTAIDRARRERLCRRATKIRPIDECASSN